PLDSGFALRAPRNDERRGWREIPCLSFRGARAASEPGIQMLALNLPLDSGSSASRGRGMTGDVVPALALRLSLQQPAELFLRLPRHLGAGRIGRRELVAPGPWPRR